jgi:hypothetical protein
MRRVNTTVNDVDRECEGHAVQVASSMEDDSNPDEH